MEVEQNIKIDNRHFKKSKYDYGKPKDDYKNYMNQYMRQKKTCECGETLNLSSFPYHMKSKKHKYQLMEKNLKQTGN